MPKTIGIKLTDSDLEKWESCAKAEGLTLTAWIRQKVNLGLAESPKKVNHEAQKEANPTEKVNLVEPEKVEKPQKSRGKSIAQEMAENAIQEVRQRGKPNQVCRALGHLFMMQDGRMTCERCGIRA